MKTACTFGCMLTLSTLIAVSGLAAEPAKSATPAKPKIYDEAADGAKQIADALVLAKKEKKLVLLQFGANWCGWCHKLHKLFESDKEIAAKLKAGYIVVLIDVNHLVDERFRRGW